MAAQVGDGDNTSGDVSVTAATGGYTRGKIYTIEDCEVVARETADAGDDCLVRYKGPIKATKAAGTGLSIAQFDAVYVTSNTVTATSTGNTRIGIALEAATATATEVLIELQPGVDS